MKKILPLSLLIFFLVAPSGSSFAQGMMQVRLKTVDGDYSSINDLKGSSLTVVDFWATWCKPCMKSIPKLVKLSHEFDENEVAFVGINADSPRNISKVRPLAKSLRIDYPVLMDTNQDLYNELQVLALPTLIILDSDGKILFSHEGYTPGDEKKFKMKIEEFLSNEN
ncbi:MAG: TlpA family protein disulfide reductase [Reichenbachiella sp.]